MRTSGRPASRISMPELSFDIDWVDAEGICGPELSATWASLRIRAGDSVLTRVLDSRAKTVREVVYVPLYPLAEWLASNWWFLTREFENPAKEGDPDFHRRHALGASREGYAFPNLEVVPSGARTRLAWDREQFPWARIEFLDRGELWMDSGEFRETCADLIDRVIRRLAALEVDETFLQEEWSAIQTADDDESRFCRTAAGLGWDPYALDDERRGQILLVAEKLGALLDEAVPAMDAENLHVGWPAIVSALEQAKRNAVSFRCLDQHGAEVVQDEGTGGSPWEAGYGLARRLRRSLGVDGRPLPTMTQIAEALDEDPALLETATRPAGMFIDTPLNRWRDYQERRSDPRLCISPDRQRRQAIPLLSGTRRGVGVAGRRCPDYESVLGAAAAQSCLCDRVSGAFVRLAGEDLPPGRR